MSPGTISFVIARRGGRGQRDPERILRRRLHLLLLRPRVRTVIVRRTRGLDGISYNMYQYSVNARRTPWLRICDIAMAGCPESKAGEQESMVEVNSINPRTGTVLRSL